ncbi:conserved protein of unknown function [Tenacibaculum sp. 190130A14a]|uniref:Uncharacterized protein n=1 Tax=Tenacibaculum polynesiense TaxID=3137857 RepID=A0ABP1EUQ5_9FLAO
MKIPSTELPETIEDTVLERNNPRFLDLTKHQIFIDTTGNSKNYKSIISWKESDLDKALISASLKELGVEIKDKNIDTYNFPIHYISLRKLNNEFVLLDPCDGIDPRFAIKKNAFVFYGPLESYVEVITKLVRISKNKIKLELKTHKSLSSDQRSILEIERIKDFLYVMTYQNEKNKKEYYLTTVDYAKDFDVVVNHCPTMKMPAIIDRLDNFKGNEIIEVVE